MTIDKEKIQKEKLQKVMDAITDKVPHESGVVSVQINPKKLAKILLKMADSVTLNFRDIYEK